MQVDSYFEPVIQHAPRVRDEAHLGLELVYSAFPSTACCLRVLAEVRWGRRPQCPYCNSYASTPCGPRYHCNSCHTSFSVLVGTCMHGTRIDPRKWVAAILLYMSCPELPSVRKFALHLDVNRNTAHRIRRILSNESPDRFRFFERIRERIFNEYHMTERNTSG